MSKEFKEISKQVYKDISSISSMEQILGRRDTLALNFIETALREAYERGVDAAVTVPSEQVTGGFKRTPKFYGRRSNPSRKALRSKQRGPTPSLSTIE